eukprot:1145437-Pelagomonas_calceolata.AAC.4
MVTEVAVLLLGNLKLNLGPGVFTMFDLHKMDNLCPGGSWLGLQVTQCTIRFSNNLCHMKQPVVEGNGGNGCVGGHALLDFATKSHGCQPALVPGP